ncbi:MAG: hypothetical protein LBI33_04270 [Propionibacteriaceae bacterium]|nr:hypothetical protein [Propionibacteriaceae bacterium]
MAAYKAQCHICNYRTKGDQPPVVCEKCGADLVNPGAEQVLRKAQGSFKPRDGKIQLGWVFLTNRRLFVVMDSTTQFAALGLVGAAIGAAANARRASHLALNIALTDIADLGEEKVTIAAKGLSILSRTYGPIGAVVVPHRDQWREANMQAAALAR